RDWSSDVCSSDLGDPYEEQDEAGGWKPQPPAIFAGQMTRPLALRPIGATELVAVRFEPDGARDWLRRPLVEATDRRLAMVDRMAGFIAPAADPARQVEAIVRFLEAHRAREGWSLDPVVRAEVGAGAEDHPSPPRSAAAQRALQRRFADRVGVSPRMLRSIFRFRRVFDHAARPERAVEGWLEAGLDAGYFDQPQMARDFRRFLGCTASEWAR